MVSEGQEAAPSSGAILDKTVFSKLSRFLHVADASSMSHMLRNIPDICHERHEYIPINFFWTV